MSELSPCPWCGETPEIHHQENSIFAGYQVCCTNHGEDVYMCWHVIDSTAEEAIARWNARYSKYPLAPVSSTLDRLLDSRFDMAAEAEADLGEIMHKGEKVTVKIKVVRGE